MLETIQFTYRLEGEDHNRTVLAGTAEVVTLDERFITSTGKSVMPLLATGSTSAFVQLLHLAMVREAQQGGHPTVPGDYSDLTRSGGAGCTVTHWKMETVDDAPFD